MLAPQKAQVYYFDFISQPALFQVEKESIQLLLVDYGNLVGSHNCQISHRDLRVPYHFGDVPILASRLILDHILPVAPGQDYRWPEFVLDDLYEMVI